MNIGFIGLGKLGLPVAAAMSVKTNKTVYGYDINPKIKTYIESAKVPYQEQDIEQYLEACSISLQGSIKDVVDKSDTVFIAVQTPHDPKFEGVTPIPEERSDFDYTYLKNVLIEINRSVTKKLNVVIISTVLPGTFKDILQPLITSSNITLIYNPYFIAMGTTISDFLYPEFILLGCKYGEEVEVGSFYNSFISAPLVRVSISSAEIVKVTYNTFIGMKIIFANTIGEIVERSDQGCSDEVFHALAHANKRIISTAYMKAGMGDGGGCHPRDQIAMSWLAKKLNLSEDIFEFIAKTREKQTKYHAEIISHYYFSSHKEVVILGEAYKKNIGLTLGSPVKLLTYYLDELNVPYRVIDPFVKEEKNISFDDEKIFYVATPHDIFKNLSIPVNSIVLDPWGDVLVRQYGTHKVNIGRGKN